MEVEFMMNGELNCCLERFIVCVECIEINFSDINDVCLVWEMKVEMLNFNFLKWDSTDDGEKFFVDYIYVIDNKSMMIQNWL